MSDNRSPNIELTTADLDKIENVAHAATPGPWFVDDAPRLAGAISATIGGLSRQVADASGQVAMFDTRASAGDVMRANALHIATANPMVVLALVAEIRARRAEATPAHDTVVYSEGDDDGGERYYGTCAPCKWISPLRSARASVDDDIDTHEQGIAVEGERRG